MNEAGRQSRPGSSRRFSSSASGPLAAKGAPINSKGRVVPRPSLKLVASSTTVAQIEQRIRSILYVGNPESDAWDRMRTLLQDSPEL